ncbi:hypothetical protein DFH07DRAFT_766760 [Mycena maculata]|uniref:NADH:flavin oxidoreductase/NADH oxidase N-terminal domain-containing protein n=1 Tax=Mycena maculata TaxID=230809 RepID=A0AAD7NUI3_9AGAR|nr:hypothetical protein DFH07DRAFT_766760 [Mycena maculata]
MSDPTTIIAQLKPAAINAKEAGFDGIELHGANGYLAYQFLYSNLKSAHRSVGGTVESPDPDSDSSAKVNELRQSRSSLALVMPGNQFTATVGMMVYLMYSAFRSVHQEYRPFDAPTLPRCARGVPQAGASQHAKDSLALSL